MAMFEETCVTFSQVFLVTRNQRALHYCLAYDFAEGALLMFQFAQLRGAEERPRGDIPTWRAGRFAGSARDQPIDCRKRFDKRSAGSPELRDWPPVLLFSMTTLDLSRQGSRVGIGRVPRKMEVIADCAHFCAHAHSKLVSIQAVWTAVRNLRPGRKRILYSGL